MRCARWSCGAFFALSLCGSAAAQHVVTVDATQPRQTIEGWGLSLAWFGNSAGGWSDVQRERIAKALFDRDTGLGLNWIRYNIGGGDNPSYPKKITRPENAVPGFLSQSGEYDWTRDERQRWMMKRAQAMGANLFEAVSFSPPYWMTVSGTSQGAEDGGSNLKSKYFGQTKGSFVDYLATVVQHYATDWGVTFRNVDPLNEPLPMWWKAGDQKQEGSHFSPEEQERLINDLGAVLARNGSMTTVAAPDENDIDNTVKELHRYKAAALAQMTQINTHSYAGSQRSGLRDLAAADGKRLTMSEWGSSPDISGKDLATQIQADLGEMGVVDWAIWQPDWPGIMRVDYNKGDFSLTPMYWVYACFTRFLKPGYQMMATHDRGTLAAYSAKDHTLVLVEQNWAAQDARVTFNLSSFHGAQVQVSGYRAKGAEALQALGTQRLTQSIFTVALPAGSVTTYVVKGVSTYADRQALADAGASTSHAELKSSQKDEAAYVSFVGRQAEVYGSYAPDAGMAAFSVDGGAETYVDLYASERITDAPLYSTPLLAPGKHTLGVRVTGLKASASTGTQVTVSRVAAMPGTLAIQQSAAGRGMNLFDFAGTWAPGADPSGKELRLSERAGDTFTIRFQGSGARVFASLAPDRGMAAFKLDDLPEVVLDLYSPTLQQDAFFFETPLVDAGTHTLTVRVLGRHDALSTESWVGANHVEVLP